MLKVVIADDELRVCRLIQKLVDWDALGMEVAGTASNGFEALDLVAELSPDILITDIRMPGCDGLELIEKAKQISQNLEIALISGYAQFEYAQTALRFDVGGYLLKPIKKDALAATLEKLGKKCKERAASSSAMESLRRDSDASHGLLRVRMPVDLLQGRLEAPTKERILSEYGFRVRDGLLQVCILKIDYSPEDFRDTAMAAIVKKADEIFGSDVLPLCLAGVFQAHGSAVYGVLNYEAQKSDQIRRALRQCLNQLEAQKYIFGAVDFSFAVGSAVDAPEKLPLSMREARDAVAERIVEGTGRLLESAQPASGLDQRKLLDKYSRAMDNVVDTLDAGAADKALEDLRHEASQIPGIRGYELLDLILAAGKMFSIRLNMKEDPGLVRGFEEGCELCSSMDRLFGCLLGFQRRQIEAMREQRENEAIRPIRTAKQYILQHYSEPISLEDVCAATGFSASYFSAMFKKETGEGFSRYLARVRVERAKALLQDTSLPVSEICALVGYSDIKHFSGTFKKTTGLNPGQYRRLYG